MARHRRINRRRTKKRVTTKAVGRSARTDEVDASFSGGEQELNDSSDETANEENETLPIQKSTGSRKSGYLLTAHRKNKPKEVRKNPVRKVKPLSDEESFEDESGSSAQEESSEEEYQDESESECVSDDDDMPTRKRTPASNQTRGDTLRASKARNSSLVRHKSPTLRDAGRRRQESTSSEDNAFVTPARKSRRSSRGRASRQESSSEGYDDSHEGEGRRSTPSRASAVAANAKLASMDKSEDAEGDLVLPKRKRRKISDEDDDEFVQVDEESDDDDASDLEGSEKLSASEKSKGNVDKEDFYDTESSQGDDVVGPSPTLRIVNTSRGDIQGREVLIDEEAEESDEDEASLSGVGGSDPRPSQSSGPSLPDCPSTEDAVTMEKLPARHICYFTPNQRSRQCFCLDTLHRIAMTSNVRDDKGKPVFLQPPHFRTPMSDDLVDQIACRFSRAALDVQGEYYRRRKGANKPNEAEHEDDIHFRQRVDRYIRNCMGSQDVFCCPLCYVEAHRRLASLTGHSECEAHDDDSSVDYEGETDTHDISLWHDPMTVLGVLDDDQYKLAASFCFRKGIEVKRHLINDHDIDPSILDGYGLFQRFKIRDGDGLLQRFIEKTFKGHTYQGDMQRYWNAGNSQSFVFLLYLMQRHESIKLKLEERISQHDEEDQVPDEDVEGINNAKEFLDSFPNRARRFWNILSPPFTKATKEDLKDFVVDGDVEDDESPHFALAFKEEVATDDQVVQQLRVKNRLLGASSDDDNEYESEEDEEGERGLDDSDEAQPLQNGYYSEEEEEDDWVKARRPSLKKATGIHTPKVGKRLRMGGSNSNSVSLETPREQTTVVTQPTSSVRKLVIAESDSE